MANDTMDSEEEIITNLSNNSDFKGLINSDTIKDNRLSVEKDYDHSEALVPSITDFPKLQDREENCSVHSISSKPNNCNSDATAATPPSAPAGSASGDADSSGGASGNTCAAKAVRLERLKVARELYERERQRKLLDILESQKLAVEFRERQKEERRKRIEDMKRREDERRQMVEDRRRRMQDAEQERRLEMLRRQDDRESRSTTRRSQTKQGGLFGFGSGTPREIFISTPDLCVTASPFGHVDKAAVTPRSRASSAVVCALAPFKKSASNTALNVSSSESCNSSDGCSSMGITTASSIRKSAGVGTKTGKLEDADSSSNTSAPPRRVRPHSMVVGRTDHLEHCMTTSVHESMSSSTKTRLSTGFNRMTASMHGSFTSSNARSKISDRRLPQSSSAGASTTTTTAATTESPAAANTMKRSRSTGTAMNAAAATPSINLSDKSDAFSEGLNSKKKTRSSTSLLAPGTPTSTPVGRMADKKISSTTPRSSSVSTSHQENKNVTPTSQSSVDSPSRSVSRSRGTSSVANAVPSASATAASAVAAAAATASAEISEEQMRQNKEAAKLRAAAIMAKVEEAKRASEEKRLAEEAALRRLEEQARQRREAEELRRVEEEQRRAAEEEAARIASERLIEETARLEEERRLAFETEERLKREEAERERAERAQKEEQERVERKRRLESIMKRVKLGGDTPREASPSPTNESTAVAAADASSPQEEQLNVAAASETTECSAAATLDVPAAEAAPAAAPIDADPTGTAASPQFRSALLQSMMTGSGRLGSSRAAEILSKHSGSSGNLRLADVEEIAILPNGGGIHITTTQNANLMSTSLPPGSAAAAILAHRRQSASSTTAAAAAIPTYSPKHENGLYNGQLEDADEEVDQPVLVCSNLHARLVESRAFAQERSSPKYELSNDNSGLKSFEQVICLDTSLLSNSNSPSGWMMEQTPSVVSDAS